MSTTVGQHIVALLSAARLMEPCWKLLLYQTEAAKLQMVGLAESCAACLRNCTCTLRPLCRSRTSLAGAVAACCCLSGVCWSPSAAGGKVQ
jgi:hypothetical protein